MACTGDVLVKAKLLRPDSYAGALAEEKLRQLLLELVIPIIPQPSKSMMQNATMLNMNFVLMPYLRCTNQKLYMPIACAAMPTIKRYVL